MKFDELMRLVSNEPESLLPGDMSALTSEEKERIYAMSEKKYNDMPLDEETVGTQVSGVEQYKKPRWQSFVSIAAALAIIAGAAGGAIYISRTGSPGVDSASSQSALAPDCEPPEETDSDPESHINTGVKNYDHVTNETEMNAIAHELTDRYAELILIEHEGLAYDPDDCIEFSIYREGDEYFDAVIGYNRVTDKRFDSTEDIKNFYFGTVTEDFDKNYCVWGGTFSNIYSAGDISGFVPGETYKRMDFFQKGDGRFADYNGNLYTMFGDPDGFSGTEDVQTRVESFYSARDIDFIEPISQDDINGITEFTATRWIVDTGVINRVYSDANEPQGTPITFTFVLTDDGWRVDAAEIGESYEWLADHAFYNYKRWLTEFRQYDENSINANMSTNPYTYKELILDSQDTLTAYDIAEMLYNDFTESFLEEHPLAVRDPETGEYTDYPIYFQPEDTVFVITDESAQWLDSVGERTEEPVKILQATDESFEAYFSLDPDTDPLGSSDVSFRMVKDTTNSNENVWRIDSVTNYPSHLT